MAQSVAKEPRTPEGSPQRLKPAMPDIKSPLHKQLATPVPSSPNRPKTPPRNILGAGSQTPGGTQRFYPLSPSRPWHSVKTSRPVSATNLRGTSAAIPPMPLPSFFLEKDTVKDVPDSELRGMLEKAVDAMDMYERSAKQFRHLANHYLLQSKLMSFENNETAQRHEVESNITKREIERLVVEFMGFSDANVDFESIRKQLKKSRQRLRDLEVLCNEKDQEIIELRRQVNAMSLNQASVNHNHNQSPSRAGPLHRIVPPINLPPPDVVPACELSPLELLASQVLSEKMQRERRPSSSSTISADSDMSS